MTEFQVKFSNGFGFRCKTLEKAQDAIQRYSPEFPGETAAISEVSAKYINDKKYGE
jgi:hypothetical protein